MSKNKNVTAIFFGTFPWMLLSFIVNLIAFLPIYFVFKYTREIIFHIFPIQERMQALISEAPDLAIFSNITVIGCKIAEFILSAAWLYIAITISSIILNAIRSYICYFLKAGHISVVCAYIKDGKVKHQLAFGMKEIINRFGSVNLMFVGDKLTRQAVLELNALLFKEEKMPSFIKEHKFIQNYMKKLTRALLIHLDEVILSYVMVNDGPAWNLYCKGLAKYVKSWSPILKDSFKTVFYVSILAGLINLLVYAVLILLVDFTFTTVILSIVIAWYIMFCIRVTFLEAYEYIHMLLAFYSCPEEEDTTILERMKDYAPSLKQLLKKGGYKETQHEIKNVVSENFDFHLNDIDKVLADINASIIPDSLEYENILTKIQNRIKRKRGKKI